MPGATLSHFEGVGINFTESRFVECQVYTYHTLKGAESILLGLFKDWGMPGATLSHFEGVGVNLT